MPESKLIVGYKALEAYVGRSRVQLWRDIQCGRFPAPIELGPNSVAWPRENIDQHLSGLPRRTYGSPEPGAA